MMVGGVVSCDLIEVNTQEIQGISNISQDFCANPQDSLHDRRTLPVYDLSRYEPLREAPSPEWFKALEAFNPAQAAYMRSILKTAGREDVCRICGDSPAQDLKIVGASAPPLASIRLCKDLLADAIILRNYELLL
jgi:hypothetical protein